LEINILKLLLCVLFLIPFSAQAFTLVAGRPHVAVGTALSCLPATWDPADGTDGDTAATQEFTCTATGTVEIASVALTTGTGFTDDATGSCNSLPTLTNGQTCDVDLTFTYTEGTYSDTLTITSDADDSPETVALGETVVSGESFEDIIFYANADTLGTTPQKGTGPMTIDAAITVDTSTPVVGAGSWDNNNGGYDNITIPAANIDWDNARIGFYWRPNENSFGHIIRATDADTDFGLVYYDETTFQYRYKDEVSLVDHGISVFDGSQAYFIEIVFTGTTAQIIIDGVTADTMSGASGTITSDLHLGASNGNQFDAVYDQIMISNDIDRDLYAIRNTVSF
jgi:hypothetical protein